LPDTSSLARMIRRFVSLAVVAGVVVVPLTPVQASGSLSGQGSTFVANFLDQCKADASKAGGPSVTYQATGSGAGRNGYIEGTVDFAASDVPFSSAEKSKADKKPYVYVPIVTGGVAVIFNVPGVKSLTLSGPTLGKIFTGKITSWNDKAIAAENPGVKLPKLVVRVVVRSDSSGTSNVFSNYLSLVAKSDWKKGATSTFPVPPVVGIGQKGSDGVGNYVGGPQGKGSITYAEVSFANERKLSVAKIINAAGKAVLPDAAAVTEAIAEASVAPDNVISVDPLAKGPTVYPIAAVAYMIVPKTSPKAAELTAFATSVLGPCQAKAAGLGYAPLPKAVVAAATKSLVSIKK
jgi:phosphate transport system substrate-binding protein